MQSIDFYVSECVRRELLTPSPMDGIYWSPAIPDKLESAKKSGKAEVPLDLGDYLIGSYASVKNAKAAANDLAPGCWSGTEIHHIVENFHLQFLGVVDTVSSSTYEKDEPCVLMAKADHSLIVENAVGVAQEMVMEVQPLDFVSVFAAANPGISKMTRTKQGVKRADWVRARESSTPSFTRHRVRDTLLEVYRFAYQESEFLPLRLIAEAVIRNMPL